MEAHPIWSPVISAVGRARTKTQLLPLLLSVIRRTYGNVVRIGPTEIEYDSLGGKPTGRARTWIRYVSLPATNAELITYNIADVLGDIAFIDGLTGTAFRADGTIVDRLIRCINFELCRNKNTGEKWRVDRLAPAIPCKLRRRMEGNPCQPEPFKVSEPMKHIGSITIIDLRKLVAPVEGVEVEDKYAYMYFRPATSQITALFTESGETHYSGEAYGRRMDIRYATCWANFHDIIPYVMWRGIALSITIYYAIYNILKEMTPGETFIFSHSAHGWNEGRKGDSWFCTDDGQCRSRVLHKLFTSAPEGVRIMMIGESCYQGSAVFGGGPYTIIDFGGDSSGGWQPVPTSDGSSTPDHELVVDALSRGKSALERELDEDGLEYIVPEFSELEWISDSKLAPVPAKYYSGLYKLLAELNGNNQYILQASTSPWNEVSFFRPGVAGTFFGSSFNVWFSAENQYKKQLDQFKQEYPGEDTELFRMRFNPNDYSFLAPAFKNYDYYYGLNVLPWVYLNTEFLDYFYKQYVNPFSNEDSGDTTQVTLEQYCPMAGFSWYDWISTTDTYSDETLRSYQPSTLTYTSKIDIYGDAFGDFGEQLEKDLGIDEDEDTETDE